VGNRKIRDRESKRSATLQEPGVVAGSRTDPANTVESCAGRPWTPLNEKGKTVSALAREALEQYLRHR